MGGVRPTRGVVSSSLVKQIQRLLRSDIVNLRLSPGEKISIPALAARFGVSRTPVREALNLLVEEGLVRLAPRVGYFVVRLTPRDIQEISDVRAMIELYALERGMARLSDDTLEAMERELRELQAMPPGPRASGFKKVDARFHRQLIACSGNRRLEAIAERIHAFVDLMRSLNVRPDAAIEEHLAIVQAMRRRDVAEARRLLALHIGNVKAVLLAGGDGAARDAEVKTR